QGESNKNTAQYTGRDNDNTGLYYYRARYYAPELKRFISSDPIGLRGGLNTYEYVGGDPVNYIDFSGNGRIAAGVCIAIAAYDAYSTGRDINDLEQKINKMKPEIKRLQAKCGSGSGTPEDFERLNDLNQELAKVMSDYVRAEMMGYIPSIITGLGCMALVYVPGL
ncbi:MAG: hypothetical protein H0W44_10645, partial [Gammaproteobacteria bacterium]|nr:hypothetical protein [Gammaproteobacteria bacterium]